MSHRVEYDDSNDRLVFTRQNADRGYWDSHWERFTFGSLKNTIELGDSFVTAETKNKLQPGSRILDAGCGVAATVMGLHRAGFEAYGIDYAERTIAQVKVVKPELNVQVGDVRSLPFPNDYFDGIWSLGVIEHFKEGFQDILDEMWRALRPGGYAFVTVPAITPLRRMKINMGLYPANLSIEESFYQFAFSRRFVQKSFEDRGWEFITCRAKGGFKGLKDEVSFLKTPLQRIYDSKNMVCQTTRRSLNLLLGPICGHTMFFLFRKGGLS
jgi:SAM-dependent methyltransferase